MNWSTKIPRERGVYWREFNLTQRPMLTSVLHFDDRRGVARVVDMEDGLEYEFSDGSHRWCPIASPAAGKWTSIYPSVSGAYWIKDRSGASLVVFALCDSADIVNVRDPKGSLCDLTDDRCDWQAIAVPRPDDSDNFAAQARASWRIQFRDGRVFVVSERAGRGHDGPASRSAAARSMRAEQPPMKLA